MVVINWTLESQLWLKKIFDYIAIDNENIAKKVITDIYQKTQILQTFPQIGYSYPNPTNLEIRASLYGHYRIAYLIKNKNNIDILGVFHGSLEIEQYL